MPEEALWLPPVGGKRRNLSRGVFPNGICKECEAIFQKKQRERKRPLWNSMQRYKKKLILPPLQVPYRAQNRCN